MLALQVEPTCGDTPTVYDLRSFIESREKLLTSALLAHARDEARRRGYRVLVIQGDPNAGRFYEACGARRVSENGSASIPGLSLPSGAGTRPSSRPIAS
ncbi:hypothetical protein [Sorangium sp. So ce176]|uniref:hypothetical protein n=1 Tax=Sorangium sp. So ce176 TaxID=3133286 RepID=UPI003F61E03A